MRGKAKFHKTEETEINVSPLIDMVFILLIFFIVATSFVNEVEDNPEAQGFGRFFFPRNHHSPSSFPARVS